MSVVRPSLEYGSEVWEGNKSQAAALESVLLSGGKRILGCSSKTCNEAVRGDLGIDTLQGRRDKAKLKWWYKLVTMPEDRYPKKLFSQDWNIKPHRGRQRKVWSRIINDLFVSLELDKAEWLKDIMDGSSSLKAFLALAGESISERESKRFEEGLNTKVKLTLYKTFGKLFSQDWNIKPHRGRQRKVWSRLNSLDMWGCVLTAPHCTYLGQLLKNPINCKIEELNLSHCSLTSEGIGELVCGLGDNYTLRDLDLVGNPITSEGVAAVATMLKTNSSLDTLWLEECSIGSDGGVELGTALEKNNTLKILWLSGNSLGDNGVRGLSIGLANNSSLKRLYLRGDESLGVEGVSLLLECLEEKNKTLMRLGLPKKYKRYISSFMSKCEVIWW